MRIDTFSSDPGVVFDRELWNELCSLRFLDDARGALLLGPVGVGKTHLATALGHVAIRRRNSVHFACADQLFRTLKAARLDNSLEAEMPRLTRLELLIIDDFSLKAMDAIETADFYGLVVGRHHKTATVLTSNRDASEWIALMSDPLLAQSAVDRLVATSYELVIEGESYRRRPRPNTPPPAARRIDRKESTDEHHHAALVVPSSWQPGGPITLASDSALSPIAGRERRVEGPQKLLSTEKDILSGGGAHRRETKLVSSFQFVADHRDTVEVKWLCEIVEISRPSYNAWLDGAAARAEPGRRGQGARATDPG